MSRIEQKLATRKAYDRKGFVPFVTAGDPDRETSLAICLKLAELGADVIELGVPFSDPMADGPTIQRSSMRALEIGVTLRAVLELAKSFSAASDVPVVLFSYFNPIMAMGLDQFAVTASNAGIDGLLLTDVIDAEAEAISNPAIEQVQIKPRGNGLAAYCRADNAGAADEEHFHRHD